MRFKVKPINLLMEETFERINQKKHFDKNLTPYKKDFLLKTLEFFEKEEEYEKCKIINDFIKDRFNHDVGYKIKET